MSWPIFYDMPAERKRRAEEAQQSAASNGRSAESNGGPTVSFCCFRFCVLSLFGGDDFFPKYWASCANEDCESL